MALWITIVMKLENALAKTMYRVTNVTHLFLDIMTLKILKNVTAIWKALKITPVTKTEYAIANVTSKETNVTNAILNITVSLIVMLANVAKKVPLMIFATIKLENVIASLITEETNAMFVTKDFLDIPIVKVAHAMPMDQKTQSVILLASVHARPML